MVLRKDTMPAIGGLSPALAVQDGGTGDTTAAGARKNLGFDSLGFGVRGIPLVSTLDWQTLDMISGQVLRVNSSTMTNIPAAAGGFGSGVITYFRRMGDSSDTRQMWEIWNDATADASSRRLQIIAVGAAGARTFIVRNIFTSADVITIANGGTGETTVAGALNALGLGLGSALPVGVPVPWSLATPPTGWLKCNGASFSATTYPELAKAYPSLKLPDLRGEFIRGWDDGRGVDAGRSVGTSEAATSIRTATLDYYGVDATSENSAVGIAFSEADTVGKVQPGSARAPNNAVLDAILTDNGQRATQNNTMLANDGGVWISVRPRNVAFNYIVRAA